MSIVFDTEGVKMPAVNKKEISKWIGEVAANYKKKPGDLAYIFCSDEKILEVNNEYLQHDFYTDIITFDYTEGDIISGDIFISLDTVRSNSEKFQTDYDEELHRVIIHGILHLCGVDDKTDEEEKEMRKAEDEALALYVNKDAK